MMPKKHSDALKARVAMAAIKGQKTVNEIASEFCIHPGMVNRWKKQAIEGMAELFADGKGKDAKAQEAEKDRLYQQIGRLQVEVDWLKKNTGHLL